MQNYEEIYKSIARELKIDEKQDTIRNLDKKLLAELEQKLYIAGCVDDSPSDDWRRLRRLVDKTRRIIDNGSSD